jgi:ABC-2 type transport system ATP-binding protein
MSRQENIVIPKLFPPIIRVDKLSKTFNDGKIKAVDNVSFEVKEGEIFGFLGPNGAGKTTTINMLTTLLKPSSGNAEVCGYDIRKHSNEVRRAVGVVPQEYTADEEMTGYDNIILCADLYGMPRSDSKPHADELLGLVELHDAARRKVSTYSGGMRRRLELACGLINYPKLLFLDEPTLGLDVQTRAAVWKYIRMLKEQYRMTLFLTTHYMEEADTLCDRIAIIDHGHIVKTGSPEELKASVGGDVITVTVKEKEPDLSAEIAQIGQPAQPPTPLRQQRIVPYQAHACMASGCCQSEPGKLRQRRRATTTARRYRREQSLCRLRIPDRVC